MSFESYDRMAVPPQPSASLYPMYWDAIQKQNPFFLEFCFCVLDYIPITYSILLCFQCHQQCLHAFCFVSGASLPALNSSVWIFCGTESEPGTRVHPSRSRTPGGTSAGVPHLCLRLLTLPPTELRIPLIIAGEIMLFVCGRKIVF